MGLTGVKIKKICEQFFANDETATFLNAVLGRSTVSGWPLAEALQKYPTL
jgi:hypothetical protein